MEFRGPKALLNLHGCRHPETSLRKIAVARKQIASAMSAYGFRSHSSKRLLQPLRESQAGAESKIK
jgi:hypothetical protein